MKSFKQYISEQQKPEAPTPRYNTPIVRDFTKGPVNVDHPGFFSAFASGRRAGISPTFNPNRVPTIERMVQAFKIGQRRGANLGLFGRRRASTTQPPEKTA